MWIRTEKHHFNLDKVTCTTIFDNELRIYLVDNDTPLTLQGEESKQVLDYLDSIAAPTWALEVPEVMKEYKES